MRTSKHVTCGLLITLILVTSPALHAADTTEPFDVGATDVDLYLGLDGVGQGKTHKVTYGEIMLGYGLTDRLSAHFGLSLESNEYFSQGAAGLSLGAYGTVFESDHLDLDLFLQLSASGDHFHEVELAPSIELNVDSHAEMLGWGLYLRAGMPISGRHTAATPAVTPGAEPAVDDHEVVLRTELTFGAYYSITEGHQLLLEHDQTVRFDPLEDERSLEVGGVALGYNVVLSDAIEMINQVFVDIPQGEQKVAFGVMTGLIATLPAGGK